MSQQVRTVARPADQNLGGRPAAAPQTSAAHDELAFLFKALGDPIRLRIVSILLRCETNEACVGELLGAFQQSGPTISHHLKMLLYAGLLTRRREGTRLYYRLQADELLKVNLLHAGAGASPLP